MTIAVIIVSCNCNYSDYVIVVTTMMMVMVVITRKIMLNAHFVIGFILNIFISYSIYKSMLGEGYNQPYL